MAPPLPARERAAPSALESGETEDQQFHLCSACDLKGCDVQALDGEMGQLDDLLVDDDTWQIEYLRVRISNAMGNKSVLVPRQWVRRVDWLNRRIETNVSCRCVRGMPAFDPAQSMRREAVYRRQPGLRPGASGQGGRIHGPHELPRDQSA